MTGRHLTTGMTLLVLVGLLALGAVIGVKSLTAPLPSDKRSTTSSPSCDPKAVRKGQRISARQVQVSVFNAGSRAGLADETMAALVKRGFRRGQIGNAPSGTTVKRVQVWTTRRNDASARLVALQLGKHLPVQVKSSDLGPGVNVVVGDKFGRLIKATRSITAKRSSSICAGGS